MTFPQPSPGAVDPWLAKPGEVFDAKAWHRKYNRRFPRELAKGWRESRPRKIETGQLRDEAR